MCQKMLASVSWDCERCMFCYLKLSSAEKWMQADWWILQQLSFQKKNDGWLRPFCVKKTTLNILIQKKKKKKKLIQLSLHPWPPRRWMQGRVWMHSAKKIKLFYNIQYRDTWHSWFTMFFLWRGLEQHVFSRGRMGCAWLPLSVSPEKCSLISSQLAATQGQRSIDNQSILQLVNCPGCWLGALGALSTSAGRDNSSFSPPPSSSCFPSASSGGFRILCMNMKQS